MNCSCPTGRLALTLAALLVALPAHATLVASYTSGVAPTAGTTGANDPTSAAGGSWTASTASPGSYNYGADSTNGGWRITDGTTLGAFFYQKAFDAGLVTNGWTASWTTAVNADAVSSAGGGVDNYYSSVPSRQNNNAFWLENNTDNYLYTLTFKTDSSGDIFLNDTVTDYRITSGGGHLSEELGAGATSVEYITFNLTYDANTGQATLSDSLGGNHGVIAQSTIQSPSLDRIVFGAFSSPGQGSTTWSAVSLAAIPEASALWSLGLTLGGLCFVERLRRRR